MAPNQNYLQLTNRITGASATRGRTRAKEQNYGIVELAPLCNDAINGQVQWTGKPVKLLANVDELTMRAVT
jgi:hypothetical protein